MNIFVYGTLRDEALRMAVAGTAGDVAPATLTGYSVRPAVGDVAPMIAPDANGQAQGLLLRNLTAEQIARLTLFEDAYGYTLITVSVTLPGGGTEAAQMWLPPAHVQAAPGAWSLDHWQGNYGAVTAQAARAVFAQDPLPAAADLRWQWPMYLKRAWAQAQAAGTDRPAAVRHGAQAGDVAVSGRVPPVGRFFKMQGFEVSHRRFDGGYQGPLPREVLVGIDAAIVLPYDARRERIVLVEQLRMGPLERGEPNSWMLEPVAGMIDAFETPEQAALRETQEEAGLDVTLRHVTSCYPSPGNATDYFYCYIGLCDLPDVNRYAGGLESEQEDLRLHVLSLDDALAHVQSGEIAAGPCVTLIYWLALNRDALHLEFATADA
ncbi:NUDIX domain-containing protein [Loktanella sp. R86503]|uniref:NUDIX domain-containing protein n=1 Tax=Loktanella sp. R86503 TaxID=3093847 RepID=UPI0036DB51FE